MYPLKLEEKQPVCTPTLGGQREKKQLRGEAGALSSGCRERCVRCGRALTVCAYFPGIFSFHPHHRPVKQHRSLVPGGPGACISPSERQGGIAASSTSPFVLAFPNPPPLPPRVCTLPSLRKRPLWAASFMSKLSYLLNCSRGSFSVFTQSIRSPRRAPGLILLGGQLRPPGHRCAAHKAPECSRVVPGDTGPPCLCKVASLTLCLQGCCISFPSWDPHSFLQCPLKPSANSIRRRRLG